MIEPSKNPCEQCGGKGWYAYGSRPEEVHICHFCTSYNARMIQPFRDISDFQPGFPGWCSLEKASTLASIVLALRPEVSLEIGVFGGSSFIPIALAHKAINFGVAIGIDPWDTNVAIAAQPSKEHRDWWTTQNMSQIYDEFMRQTKVHQLEKFTRIIRQTSSTAPCPNAIGLLHVDGAHDARAISDVLKFAPYVKTGGFLVMDDMDGNHGPAPALAAQHLPRLGFKQLYSLGTGFCYQRNA